MKNSQIITTINSLVEIVNSKVEYSRKVSYAITKNLLSLQKLYEPYEEERKKILEKYGEKDADPEKDVVIPEKNRSTCEKEMTELLEIEVAFEPHMVSLEEFPENVSPSLLYALDFMIEG